MASNQLVRQWNVLQELASSRMGRTLSELARVTGASGRTVRRDIDDLGCAGFPIEKSRDGRSVRFLLARGARLPDIPLLLPEALALHQAAMSTSLFENPGYHDSLESALQKVLAALPAGVRDYLGRNSIAWSHRLEGPKNPELSHTIRVLQEQAAAGCRVRFGYENLNGEVTERTVDPYLLRAHKGDIYLLALCHLRGAVRVFHTNRIRSIEPLDEEYRMPAGFESEALFAASLGIYLGEAGHAVIRFEDAAARYILERPLHPDQSVLERADGYVVVRVPVRGHEEVVHEVLRFGGLAEVLGPQGLRERMGEEVARLAERYGGTGGHRFRLT